MNLPCLPKKTNVHFNRKSILTGGDRFHHFTYETGGVVVPDCFGVAVRLQDGISLDDPVLQVGLLLGGLGGLGRVGAQDGEVGDDLFVGSDDGLMRRKFSKSIEPSSLPIVPFWCFRSCQRRIRR